MSETHHESDLTKKDVQELLKGKFGQDLSVVDFTCKPATKAGDNYGSTLLALDVSILSNNISQTLHIIAKLVPPTEFLREVFNVTVTFCKEINLYKLVYPALIEIQQECGIQENEIINLVPIFYGGRTSYDKPENKSEDFDAVLLLGNLKVHGYQIADRLNGLNLQHCELGIRSLASLHALCVALREKKPSTFKETVLKATVPFHIGPMNVDEVQERIDFVETLVKNVPECRKYIERIQKCIVSHIDVENASLGKEPFATFVHNDFWTNNVLFKYEEGSECIKPCDIKIVDFQITKYCSPVHDILFFLYSSAQRQVVENYYDHLIDLYYDTFVFNLKKLECNVQAFSKFAFLGEFDSFASFQLYHILFMLSVIYAGKEETSELSEFKSKDNMFEVGGNEVCRKKIIDIINDFDKKGWIKEKI